MGRLSSPISKKQRLYRSSSPPTELSQSTLSQRVDDAFSMSHSNGTRSKDPRSLLGRPGNLARKLQQPAVVDVVEVGIELVHVDPGHSQQPPSHRGLSVSGPAS